MPLEEKSHVMFDVINLLFKIKVKKMELLLGHVTPSKPPLGWVTCLGNFNPTWDINMSFRYKKDSYASVAYAKQITMFVKTTIFT